MQKFSPNFDSQWSMGDYGWSMDSDTPQGIDAVEYGRVLEYPKKRNKMSDHEKARSIVFMAPPRSEFVC